MPVLSGVLLFLSLLFYYFFEFIVIIIQTIFKAAISDLGVDVVCTLYEADRHIAHIASSLNPGMRR
jgi:hypothetical protein